VESLVERAAAAAGVRTDTPEWKASIVVAEDGAKQAIREKVMGGVGTVEGAALAITGIVDDLMYIPFGIVDAVDYAVDEAAGAAGLSPEQTEVARTLAHIAARDNAEMLKAARTYLAKQGMTDDLTGAPIISGLVTKAGDWVETSVNQTLGLSAEEGFTTREIDQIVGNIAVQAGLAEIGVREVQAVLKVAALAGSIRAVVSAAAEAGREGKKWYASPKFWVLVGGALLSLVGLKQTTGARKLLQLFVDLAGTTLSVAPAVITYFDHLANYHKEDRDKVLHKDAVGVANAAAGAMLQLIKHVTSRMPPKSSGTKGPPPVGAAEAERPTSGAAPAVIEGAKTGQGETASASTTASTSSTASQHPSGAKASAPAPERLAPRPAPAAAPPAPIAARKRGSAPAKGQPVKRAQTRQRSPMGGAKGAERRAPNLRERSGPADRPQSQRLQATGTTDQPDLTVKGPRLLQGGKASTDQSNEPHAVLGSGSKTPSGAEPIGPQTSVETGTSAKPSTTSEAVSPATGTVPPGQTASKTPASETTSAKDTEQATSKPAAKGKWLAHESLPSGPEWTRVRKRVVALQRQIERLPKSQAGAVSRKNLTGELQDAVKGLNRDGPESANQYLTDIEDSAGEATRLSRAVSPKGLQAFRERLVARAEEARGQRRRDIQELIDRTDGLLAEQKAGKPVNAAQAVEEMGQQLGRAGEQHFAVHVPMYDENVRAEVRKKIEALTAKMENYPGGELARAQLLMKLAALGQMDLVQSPRATGGENLVDTARMRERFKKYVEQGKLGDAYRDAFDQAKGARDWPETPDGRPWELDHTIELWQSGPDDLTNVIALDPRLHSLKTEAMEKFRREYRDKTLTESTGEGPQTRAQDVEKDVRERDPD
jgi:hypothetical protein